MWGPSSARDNIWENSTFTGEMCTFVKRVVFVCKDLLGCDFLYIYRRDIISFQNIYDSYTKKNIGEKQSCLCASGLPVIVSLEQRRQPTVVYRAASI